MRRLASCLLVAGLAIVGAGCGASKKTVVYNEAPFNVARVAAKVPKGVRVGPGPFLWWGAAGGGQSGMFGDGGDGPHGTSIGCLNGRRYSDALGIQNSTKVPLRLTAVSAPNPGRRIADRVAIQLRLSPPYRRPTGSFDAPSGLVYGRWSRAAAKPVTIPPGRIASVQRDFLLRNCHDLGEGKEITIPGSLVVRYRRSGHAERQKLTIRSDQLDVVHGPTRHTCTPIAGSASLFISDVSCAFASRAAPLCRAMHNGGWLGCTVDGRYWECGRFAGPGFPLFETCYLPHDKSHWFSIVWVAPGLGLWGAIQNRRANIEWPRLDVWRTTKGTCESRSAGNGLVFESSALRILTGRYSTRVPADARVRFVVPNFRGPGHFSANGSTVQVTVQRRGTTYRSYPATAGRLTVTRVTKDSISGNVYANLLQKNGKGQSQLNGSWICRTTVG